MPGRIDRRPMPRLRPWFSTLMLLAATWWPATTPATEVLADLDVDLQLLGVTPDAKDASTATARILVTIGTFLETDDIRVRFLRSDGVPGTAAAQEVDPGFLNWSTGESRRSAVDFGSVSRLGARDSVRAVLDLPLPGPGVFELVAKVAGTSVSGPVRTEAMVHVPFGVDLPRPEIKDGVAEFRAMASEEVRP